MNEKKLSQGFMFDTNIFNSILDGEIEIELFNRFKLYVTHIQSDELTNTRNIQRREKLTEIFQKIPQEKMPTESGAWNISSWDDFKWSDPNDHLREEILAEMDSRKKKQNNQQDSLIAETALKNNLILVTNDGILMDTMKRFNGKSIGLQEFLDSTKEMTVHE
jgi:predicted nucleic acid-binding protein